MWPFNKKEIKKETPVQLKMRTKRLESYEQEFEVDVVYVGLRTEGGEKIAIKFVGSVSQSRSAGRDEEPFIRNPVLFHDMTEPYTYEPELYRAEQQAANFINSLEHSPRTFSNTTTEERSTKSITGIPVCARVLKTKTSSKKIIATMYRVVDIEKSTNEGSRSAT